MDRGKLAERVVQWTTDELHFGKEGQIKPKAQHVQKLCIGNMVHVWNFLLSHVKSEEEVQKIRGNLLLNSKKNLSEQREEEEKREKLISQRDSIRAQLAETNTNISKLQLELSTLKSDMESEENKQCVIIRNIREREVRNTMLESYDRSQGVYTNIMREYQARLVQVISHLKNSKTRTTNVSATQKPHSTLDPESIYAHGSTTPIIESNSMRIIREICEYVKDAYEQHTNQQQIDLVVKDKLKNVYVTDGVRAYEVLDTLNNLAIAVSKSSVAPEENTNGKNRSKTSKGVAEQLHELRAAHAERFFRTLSLRQTAHANADAPKTQAQANLPAHAAQLRHMQATLRGLRAALRVINEKIVELQLQSEAGIQSGVEERVTQVRAQLARMLRIRSEHAKEIGRLKSENVDYMGKINAARQVMQAIVQANISPAKNALMSAREAYANNAKLEVEYLDKLDLTKTLPATLGRSKELKEEGILSTLKASHNGPETLLQKLFAAKTQLEDAVLLLQYERRLVSDARSGPVSVNINNPKAISNIEKKNEAYMEGQRQLAKQQKELQHQAEQAISKAIAVRQSADIWWQQPAQFVVPWVTVDGRSMEEFLNEWRSLCALLEPI